MASRTLRLDAAITCATATQRPRAARVAACYSDPMPTAQRRQQVAVPVGSSTAVSLSRRRQPGIGLAVAMTLLGTMVLMGCAHRSPRFDVQRRQTCLVLSAGATRGIAHLGALRAVQEANIPVSCLVGTSVGALMGGLYATAPRQDTTARFHRLAQGYLAATEREAHARGLGAGALLAAVAASVSSGVLAPAGAALGGYFWGAATTSQADKGRLEEALRGEVAGAQIGALPIRFATLHHERSGQGVKLVVDQTGDLASAIGASIANPFVFDDVNVTRSEKIDPGSDRVAATPVQEACTLFPNSNLLVVNVTGARAFYDREMHCPLLEIRIDVPDVPPDEFFSRGLAFEAAWRAGYQQTARALAVPPAPAS